MYTEDKCEDIRKRDNKIWGGRGWVEGRSAYMREVEDGVRLGWLSIAGSNKYGGRKRGRIIMGFVSQRPDPDLG